MRQSLALIFLLFMSNWSIGQSINDDFEGSGNISAWVSDDCELDARFPNPFKNNQNTSATVLRYKDNGGQYANIRFDIPQNFDLSYNTTFSIKIYVASATLVGNQPNQVSLKLQNNDLVQPWVTQTEIIKPIVLNQWQTITFSFSRDDVKNLDNTSGNPRYRTDLNRVLLQVNGENNNSLVTAFIDDFVYDYIQPPVYDNLVWSDEFNGSGAIKNTNWYHQTRLPNGTGWYNDEVQHYTDRTINSFEADGNLHIVAQKETYTNQGQTKQYTSARLNSKFDFQYGKVEFSAKMAFGKGTWPAVWMLGKNIIEPGGYWTSNFGTKGWPACGEIDILEHWGKNQNYCSSALHTPSSSGNTSNVGGRIIDNASTEFNKYTLEWSPQQMIFKINDMIHYIYDPAIKNNDTWPFDAPQYLLLNVAIEQLIEASFVKSSMLVDYIRVYQETPLTDVSDISGDSLTIFPIPADDKLKISTSMDIKEKGIYDLNGQLLKSIKNDLKEMSIIDLPKGVYLLKITLKNDQSITKKIVKN